eukprot:5071516-Pleurochrysis_carterae.AAC.1
MHSRECDAVPPGEQPLFRLGGAQTLQIIVKSTLIDYASQLHDQPTSPSTHRSFCPSLPSQKGSQTLHS